jgi:hypothetical protein
MGRYAIITNPVTGTPKVLMICDSRVEAAAILVDLCARGTPAKLWKLGAAGTSPTSSLAGRT